MGKKVIKSRETAELPVYEWTDVKTFEYACEVLGLDPDCIPILSDIPRRFKKPLMACYKLMIVFEAINQGWVPDLAEKKSFKHVPVLMANGKGKIDECRVSSFSSSLRSSLYFCCKDSERVYFLINNYADLLLDFFIGEIKLKKDDHQEYVHHRYPR